MESKNKKINLPYYKKIFSDILDMKYPEKRYLCQQLLDKETLTHLDVINLNTSIFGKNITSEDEIFNHQHRFYSKSDIVKVLTYQHKNNLSNSELGRHYKISRNTIAKWKKLITIDENSTN